MDRVANWSAQELYRGIFQRTELYRRVQSWFDSADIVAMPTLSRTALPIDQDFFGPIEVDGEAVPNLRAAWYPYTMPFNLTGNPAVRDPRLAELSNSQPQLAASVLAWLDSFGEVRDAAEQLHIHPNTLRYRVRRAEQVTGIDLSRPEQRLLAMLQLRLPSA